MQEKYARLWHTTCDWKIPPGYEPFKVNGELTDREIRLYAEGMWKVLDEMTKDGLISVDTLRRMHEKDNGWKIGESKITI